jgi:hypothetical protein
VSLTWRDAAVTFPSLTTTATSTAAVHSCNGRCAFTAYAVRTAPAGERHPASHIAPLTTACGLDWISQSLPDTAVAVGWSGGATAVNITSLLLDTEYRLVLVVALTEVAVVLAHHCR